MEKGIFILSILLAILFIFTSKKMASRWIRLSFVIYSCLFFLIALSAGGLFISNNKTAIITATQQMLPWHHQHSTDKLISQHKIKSKVKIEAPLIKQLPELPRGCEVTSLAMLLSYHDIPVDKMTLAREVKKNPAKFKENDTGIYFGDPNNGFVGNMYTFSEPGYGVYHKPVAALAKKYAGDRVNDLSGKNFSEVLAKLNQNKPVWVIINATYKKLPKSEFITWQTKQGEIHITMREHSVLVTGYDDKYIYFNDPLNKHTRAPINDFILAWEQMGKQAIAL